MLKIMDEDLLTEDFSDTCRMVRRSGLLHSNWYRRTYPDVALSGMDPSEHYLQIGAALGRNPGKKFDTRFYLGRYPEVAEQGLNPLVHYITQGADQGYLTRPDDPRKQALREAKALRNKLLTLGFTKRALAALSQTAAQGETPLVRALASRELGLWHMRLREGDNCRIALRHFAAARAEAPDLAFRRGLVISELLCHHFLDARAAGLAFYDRIAEAGESSPNALLARGNFETEPEARCDWINRVLALYGLSPVQLSGEAEVALTPYDRLTGATDLPAVWDGPKVTVLLAAYAASEMLPTALRSLQQQSWRNLEILVIDDCSPDDTCAVAERFAAEDPRIRLIRMETNGGAYVARNRGLDEAQGDFVTIHDADDWSHPAKIETQMRYMLEHPEVMGCTSEQARATEDLRFTKVRGNGAFILFNTSSFLWRRAPVREALGYWDTVRFGADSEFMRRMQMAFGKESVVRLRTGPLSFQRESDASITTDPVMGVDGFYYGVRKEYYDAHTHHHKTAETLKYTADPATRPFPVPPMMRPERAALLDGPRRFDLVVYGDFRQATPEIEALASEIAERRDQGCRIGLVECCGFDADIDAEQASCEEIRRLIDGDRVQFLVYGDEAIAGRIAYLGNAGTGGRYLPVVREETNASL